MNQLEQLDYALRALYLASTMIRIKESFVVNGQQLTQAELLAIKNTLHLKGYAHFQTEPYGADYRSSITDAGRYFVETDSFSRQGTSILNL